MRASSQSSPGISREGTPRGSMVSLRKNMSPRTALSPRDGSPRVSPGRASSLTSGEGRVVWNRVTPFSHQAAPKKRKGHTMVTFKNKLYLFGGFSGTVTGDFWVYSPESTKWKRLDVTGMVPCKRTGHSACMYGSKMIIFGGDSGSNEILNDLWEIDLAQSQLQWLRLYPYHTYNSQLHDINEGPRPRYAHSAVVIGDSMIVFGGYGGMYLDECWQFDLTGEEGWTRIIAQHQNVSSKLKPSRRCYHSAIALPLDDSMLLFGGSNGQYLNDVWWFHLPTLRWRKVIPTLPASASSRKSGIMSSPSSTSQNDMIPVPRAKHACTRVFGDHLLIHGGTTGLFREADTWLFRVTTSSSNMHEDRPLYGEWTRMDGLISGSSPIARDSHTVVASNSDRDLWLFGGSGKGTYFNDMWHCHLDRKRDTIAINATNNSPSRRVHFSAKNIVSGEPSESEFSEDLKSEDDRKSTRKYPRFFS
jgi:hypothetical protein